MRNYNPWRVLLAFVFTPALWPVAFIVIAMTTEGFIDPLLGGIQDILYWMALVWMLYVFAVTLLVAKVFKLRRTVRLYLATCLMATLSPYLTWAAVQLYVGVGIRRLDDMHLVFHPDAFWIGGAIFLSILSLVTGGVFAALGGLGIWQSGQKPASAASG